MQTIQGQRPNNAPMMPEAKSTWEGNVPRAMVNP